MNFPALSWASSNDYTSRRNPSFPTQASASNEARSAGSRHSTASQNRSISFHLSSCIFFLPTQFTIEPRFCFVPFAERRRWRDTKKLGRLIHTQASEEAQFHNSSLAGIKS